VQRPWEASFYPVSLLSSSSVQVKVFLEGLFHLNHDIPAFKEHLRDFLVQIKEVAGDDPADLFIEEREVQLRQAAEEKRRQQLAVPGIINPHDRPDEMQE